MSPFVALLVLMSTSSLMAFFLSRCCTLELVRVMELAMEQELVLVMELVMAVVEVLATDCEFSSIGKQQITRKTEQTSFYFPCL